MYVVVINLAASLFTVRDDLDHWMGVLSARISADGTAKPLHNLFVVGTHADVVLRDRGKSGFTARITLLRRMVRKYGVGEKECVVLGDTPKLDNCKVRTRCASSNSNLLDHRDIESCSTHRCALEGIR